MSDKEHRKVKTALDETRLLILGAEVLFGFHINAAFQQQFTRLSDSSRVIYVITFSLMALAIAFLITPSLQHRLIDDGRTTSRIIKACSRCASVALLPFALSLGGALYIVITHRFGRPLGTMVGTVFAGLAITAWYVAGWLMRQFAGESMAPQIETPIDIRVEHMLTEARVLLPGAQALFGFQLAILLTDAFEQLSYFAKAIHVLALSSVALAMILLMTPASLHRISFRGHNTETFHQVGSCLVVAASVPLACGIVGDLYVATTRALESTPWAIAVSAGATAILLTLWFAYPLMLRAQRR